MSQTVHHYFDKLNRLPPYILAEVIELMKSARRSGEDVIDLGMGNPDLPTPAHVVDKIAEAAKNPRNHRYSASRGIPNLRAACTEWYRRNHGVELDPEHEAIAVIGAKEGVSHFVLMTVGPGDVVLCPDPAYPIHQYSVIIAGGDLRHVPLSADSDFIANLEQAIARTWPKPKMLILSFPHNPTTTVVDRPFFERIIAFAKEHDLMVLHDFAYAEICFDGYKPPEHSPGARRAGSGDRVHCRSRRATRCRAGGWASQRGTREMIHALARIKSYLDYGMPDRRSRWVRSPRCAGPRTCVAENQSRPTESPARRPDRRALRARAPAPVEDPQAPGARCSCGRRFREPFRRRSVLIEFSKRLAPARPRWRCLRASASGSPATTYVRFALVENKPPDPSGGARHPPFLAGGAEDRAEGPK